MIPQLTWWFHRAGWKAGARGGAALVLAVAVDPVHAQVVPDGKFGSSAPLTGPSYNIPSDLGATRGNNLFHSFTRFDLKAGETATFSGPANIQNILGRVTGGNPSSIDGTVRSSITGANLFLVNPSGIVFGPNAVVDVSGSFAATSANYLKLANGARFVASLDADDSTLTTDPVVAFGFLEGAAGTVEVRGSLKVAPGGSIALVGSGVTVADGARLEAANGLIQLTGVSAAGEVPVPSATPVVAPSVATQPAATDPGVSSPKPGTVVIRGGRLVVDNAQIAVTGTGGDIDIKTSQSVEVLNGGQISTTGSGTTQGGTILINSPSVIVDGQDGELPTRIAAETSSDVAEAPGGDVVIRADLIELRRGAEISVSTFNASSAGKVDIDAGTVRVIGSDFAPWPSQIAANASPLIGGPAGAGGGISIKAQSVEVNNGGGILAGTTGDAAAGVINIEAASVSLKDGGISTFTAGAGKGGEIHVHGDRVTVDGSYASITAQTTGKNNQSIAGEGGLIDIKAGIFQLLNDGGVSATTYGDGRGGNINITADSMVLDTAVFQPGSIPGIAAASKPPFLGTGGGGNGGDIKISTGSLSLHNRMLISTSTETKGAAGSIEVHAGSLSLDSESSIQSASTATGKAGSLSIQSVSGIRLTGHSSVNTSAPDSSGGDIHLTAGSDIQVIDSQVNAQAGPGGGGNITLDSPSMVYLLNGTLTAQAVGDGGNLTIDPVFIVLNNGSLISKSSSANGGNITILSDYFLTSASLIDASAPFGLPGTVSVSAPSIDLSGSLVELPGNLLGVETLLRPDCGVRLTGNISSFIVLGRGGLPLVPGGFVPSGSVQPPDENK